MKLNNTTLKGSDIYRKQCSQEHTTPTGSHKRMFLFSINIESLRDLKLKANIRRSI